MLADIRTALRTYARTPLLAVTAVITMALGIGANTAVFSFVSALLLRPMPYPEPERLVTIDSVRGGERGKLTPREWEELNQDSVTFDGVAAWYPSQYNLTGAGAPEVVRACMTTANLFRVLGVGLAQGTSWQEGTHRERNPVLVLGHSTWQRRFGGDRAIVGGTIVLDSSAYQVVGVAGAGFEFPGRMDVYRSAHLGGAQNWDVRSLFVVGRLRPGVTLQQAQEKLKQLGARMEQTYPGTNQGVAFHARGLRETFVGEVRPYLLLTLGLAGLVLLIACSNLTNLLLSRGLSRRKELAIRSALGAGRGRIARQLVTETLVLAVTGGAVGVAFAYWWTGVLSRWLRLELPAWMAIGMDWRVLVFALAMSMAAGVAAGILPGLSFSRTTLNEVMRDSSRGVSGGQTSSRLRGALVTGELALALALLVAAGLLVKSFQQLDGTETGFARTPALTFRTDPPWARYSKVEQTAPFYRRALERLSEIPGVTGVAANHSLPLALNQNYGKPVVEVEGQSVEQQQRNPFVNVQIVSPNYFAVMGIPLYEGRGFTEDDRMNTRPVAVISRPLARRLFGEEGAVGRRVKLPGLLASLTERNERWIEIVGLAEGVRSDGLAAPPSLDIYLSNQQQFAGDTFFIVRTAQRPEAIARNVAQAIQEVDPEQPLFDLQPLEERIAGTVWQRRMAGALSLCFGGLALVLAAIGVYGVLSHLVGQRTRGIGIRQALGATPGSVWWMVVRDGLVRALAGLAVGLAVSVAGSRLLESMLYGVQAFDAGMYAGAAAVTLLVGLASSAAPAWRAAGVRPAEALRTE
ncbi:MAG: ABC transporter permease [Bryobacterales bacterium]|nr:ABC transporter permease [Bryobacterales bacterium]